LTIHDAGVHDRTPYLVSELLEGQTLREALISGSPLGYSQVTSVVDHNSKTVQAGPTYPIGFFAHLVYPYFIELSHPTPLGLEAPSAQSCGACPEAYQRELAI